jgi:hypothetical protein
MGLVITYDLRAPGRDYKPLYAELERLKAWRVLQSVWCYGGAMEPGPMMEHVLKFLDGNDGLFITTLGVVASSKTL